MRCLTTARFGSDGRRRRQAYVLSFFISQCHRDRPYIRRWAWPTCPFSSSVLTSCVPELWLPIQLPVDTSKASSVKFCDAVVGSYGPLYFLAKVCSECFVAWLRFHEDQSKTWVIAGAKSSQFLCLYLCSSHSGVLPPRSWGWECTACIIRLFSARQASPLC